jgi:hypothetical protein
MAPNGTKPFAFLRWDTMSAIASDTVGVVTTGCQKWLEQKQSIHLTCTELNGPKLPEHNKPQ